MANSFATYLFCRVHLLDRKIEMQTAGQPDASCGPAQGERSASDVALLGRLQSFIATRDRRAAKASGYGKAPISEHFARLQSGQVVRVGGRASCGGRVDPSWVEFTAWNEVVRKARSLGMQITQVPVKHGNGWATKAGGFWNENDYQLARTTS